MCRCVNARINLTEALKESNWTITLKGVGTGFPLPRVDLFVNNKFKWQNLASTSNTILVKCSPHIPPPPDFVAFFDFSKFSSFPTPNNYRRTWVCLAITASSMFSSYNSTCIILVEWSQRLQVGSSR